MSSPDEIPRPSLHDIRQHCRELCAQLEPMPPEAIDAFVDLLDDVTPAVPLREAA